MLQQRGHLTAMTGDGVSKSTRELYCLAILIHIITDDAPSLKKADCGIAVEGASDAARAAADVVFLDEGLSTIITSIKVARQIFHRRLYCSIISHMGAYRVHRYESLHRLSYRTLYPFGSLPGATPLPFLSVVIYPD